MENKNNETLRQERVALPVSIENVGRINGEIAHHNSENIPTYRIADGILERYFAVAEIFRNGVHGRRYDLQEQNTPFTVSAENLERLRAEFPQEHPEDASDEALNQILSRYFAMAEIFRR